MQGRLSQYLLCFTTIITPRKLILSKRSSNHRQTVSWTLQDVLLESRNEKFFSGKSPEIPQLIQNEVFDKFTKKSGGKVFFKEATKTPVNPNVKRTAKIGTKEYKVKVIL